MMIKQAIKYFWRLFTGIVKLPFLYRKTIVHLYREWGIKGVYNFFFVKIFARGERVGLQALDPISMNFPALTPYPYMLEIEITTRCHLKCTICEHTYWEDKTYYNQDLTFANFKRILDNFPKLKYINLTGEGSSFLNKDFIKMLELCNDRKIYTTVIDSFTAITEEQLEAMIVNNVGRLVLSIDGATKETYEKVRVGANFEKVRQNVNKFRRLREKHNSPLPEFMFRYIFMKDNYKELPIFPQFVNTVKINDTSGYDNHIELTALLPFPAISHLTYEPEKSVIDATNKMLKDYRFKYAWSHPSHVASKKRPMCECVAWAEPYIMVTGHVISCCSILMSDNRKFLEEHSFGNIYEKHFIDIWNSARYRKFRKSVPGFSGPVPKSCEDCRAFDCTERVKRYGVI